MTDSILSRAIADHRTALAAVEAQLDEPLAQLTSACVESVRAGGRILLFGNGGSAADAQHIAAELVVKLKADRRPIAAIALTVDSSILTAAGNDYGYDSVFSRQVEALGRPGDIAIGISTSGNSPNVLKALEAARAGGLFVAGFAGKDGGQMAALCDLMLTVPVADTARIQEMHILLGHCLCAGVEQGLGLV